MTRHVWILCCCLALACSSKDDSKTPSPKAPVKQQPTPTPVETPPPARTKSPLSEHMQGHFAAISGIQAAVVDGELPKIKSVAAWLAEHSEHGDVAWKAELEAVRATAKELSTVASLTKATPLAARLAGQCGNCHVTMTTITSFQWSPVPNDGPTVVHRMLRHRWALKRLWEGLVGPSTTSWFEGTKILAADALPVAKLAKASANTAQVGKFASTLQGLAKRGQKADTHAARTAIYGELLGTCAGCHKLTRKPKP